MGRVGRFQVMATLQAARAEALGLDEDAARSWGLNRAIFYAAAKRGFRRTGTATTARPPAGASERRSAAPPAEEREYRLGDELAYVAGDTRPGLRFEIGDEVQTPADFRNQIERRFDDWDAAWTEAKELVSNADQAALKSQRRFFDEIYRPLRDTLARRWSGAGARS